LIDPTKAHVLTPTKDANEPYPIAAEWRPVFQAIVRAFVERDYTLSRGLPNVRLRSDRTAELIRDQVADYGETLVELPEDTWRTSEALWMGDFWEIFVDLWTAGEGRSDLVLKARVFETEGGYAFEVSLVYVP
jgi:hypothetical protein